jgi:hypothetical protein
MGIFFALKLLVHHALQIILILFGIVLHLPINIHLCA